MYNPDAYDAVSTRSAVEVKTFISKVYAWMSFALVITALVAMYVASQPNLVKLIVGMKIIFYGLLIGELLVVGALVGFIEKMSAATATAVFFAYSVMNGLTLSVIFLAYTSTSITSTFFITAGTFGVMSAYGYFTKRDLTSVGNICFMALIGLIIATIVNIFWTNNMFSLIISCAGVLIFVGLTAYDTQRIKELGATVDEGSEAGRKGAVMGALALYLDFINLFLMLLRLFGDRR
ncbi:MAG: Bax inhibitor-1/YccA family protein [Victivallales bacterium]